MIKRVITLLTVLTLSSGLTVNAQEYVVEDPFIHDRSVVNADGTLGMASDSAPIYQQLEGLLPRDWEMAFTEQYLAIAPIEWAQGEEWSAALNSWGIENNANVMIDGERKKVVVSPEQEKRPPGTVFVFSGNELHQELYRPEARYNEVKQYVHSRLEDLHGSSRDDLSLHLAQAQLLKLQGLIDDREMQRDALMAERDAAIADAKQAQRAKISRLEERKRKAKQEQSQQDRYWVKPGTFKENFERLAKAHGFGFVAWDPRVEKCQWQQSTTYRIPRDKPKELLAFYASTLDFYLMFSSIDKHIKVMYRGPMQRLSYCE